MAISRNADAAKRFAERRQREDEARRLQAVVPELESLRLTIESRAGDSATADCTYVRHIVVARAPALFVIPCANSSCRDGGHDVTYEVLRALEASRQSFEGEDRCGGSVGNARCPQIMTYVAAATYR